MLFLDTAVILAGGRSSRMGFDKRFITLGGMPVLERQIETLSKLFSEIILVANNETEMGYAGCRIVLDELQDFGPLGGIHAGLKASNSLYAYFIACDMPFINEEYILYMQNRLQEEETEVQAAVTRLGQWVEPFNAYYSKSLLPSIEEAYRQKQQRISRVLDASKVLYIEESQARSFSPDWTMFSNINTPQDLAKAEAALQKSMVKK